MVCGEWCVVRGAWRVARGAWWIGGGGWGVVVCEVAARLHIHPPNEGRVLMIMSPPSVSRCFLTCVGQCVVGRVNPRVLEGQQVLYNM